MARLDVVTWFDVPIRKVLLSQADIYAEHSTIVEFHRDPLQICHNEN